MELHSLQSRWPFAPAICSKQIDLRAAFEQGPQDLLDVNRAALAPEYRHSGVSANVGDSHRSLLRRKSLFAAKGRFEQPPKLANVLTNVKELFSFGAACLSECPLELRIAQNS